MFAPDTEVPELNPGTDVLHSWVSQEGYLTVSGTAVPLLSAVTLAGSGKHAPLLSADTLAVPGTSAPLLSVDTLADFGTGAPLLSTDALVVREGRDTPYGPRIVVPNGASFGRCMGIGSIDA